MEFKYGRKSFADQDKGHYKLASKAKPAAQAKAAPVAKVPVKAAAKPPAANTVTLKHLATAMTDQHDLE